MVGTEILELETKGNTDIIDITDRCAAAVRRSGVRDGIFTVFNPGSTGGLTTIEFEPNLVEDLREALETVAPSDRSYRHGMTWNDDNGSSHIRSSIMGPSFSVPVVDGALSLGTWQQIVFCDFDTRPRDRRLILQVVGE